MIIGKLRHQIQIQSCIDGRGVDGSVNKTFTTVATIWADVKEASQGESEIGTKKTTTSLLNVVVRANNLTGQIDTSYHLIYNGENYLVEGIVTDERKIYRTINARLIQ